MKESVDDVGSLSSEICIVAACKVAVVQSDD